jgi:hypothetical protein
MLASDHSWMHVLTSLGKEGGLPLPWVGVNSPDKSFQAIWEISLIFYEQGQVPIFNQKSKLKTWSHMTSSS